MVRDKYTMSPVNGHTSINIQAAHIGLKGIEVEGRHEVGREKLQEDWGLILSKYILYIYKILK